MTFYYRKCVMLWLCCSSGLTHCSGLMPTEEVTSHNIWHVFFCLPSASWKPSPWWIVKSIMLLPREASLPADTARAVNLWKGDQSYHELVECVKSGLQSQIWKIEGVTKRKLKGIICWWRQMFYNKSVT